MCLRAYLTRNCQDLAKGSVKPLRMGSRSAKWRCFVSDLEGHGNAEEWQTDPATFPFSLHRAERSRTIDKTPPPSDGVRPRDDNIPLVIAIIPLYYSAFRDPDATGATLCRFTRGAFCRARPERQYISEKIYKQFACSRARTPRLQTRPRSCFIPKYQKIAFEIVHSCETNETQN